MPHTSKANKARTTALALYGIKPAIIATNGECEILFPLTNCLHVPAYRLARAIASFRWRNILGTMMANTTVQDVDLFLEQPINPHVLLESPLVPRGCITTAVPHILINIDTEQTLCHATCDAVAPYQRNGHTFHRVGDIYVAYMYKSGSA